MSTAATIAKPAAFPPEPKRGQVWNRTGDMRAVVDVASPFNCPGTFVVWTRPGSMRLNVCWRLSWMRWVSKAVPA